MKCLRALPGYLFGELRTENDIAEAPAHELLIVPPTVCDDGTHDEGECICRRSFLGTCGRGATTLAYVSEEPDDELFEEFHASPLARAIWKQGRMFLAARHLVKVASAAEVFSPGQVVRVRTNGTTSEVYPAGLLRAEDSEVSVE